MQCVEELSPEACFDLDEIEALPAFAFTETTSATACTYTVTLASENSYDGDFCYAQSPLGLWVNNNVVQGASAYGTPATASAVQSVQVQMIQQAVDVGLTAIGQPQPYGTTYPAYNNFAGVSDPSFSDSWAWSFTMHGTAVESVPIPGSDGYGVKVYQDPDRGTVAAVTPVPWYGPAHIFGAIGFALGENVNLGYASDILTEHNYPFYEYNIPQKVCK